jgi:hypothetical protein
MTASPRLTFVRAAAAVLALSGLLTAVCALPGLDALSVAFLDLIILPLDGAQSLSAAETRVWQAIGGGVTTALGVAMWQMATEGAELSPVFARRAMLRTIWSWFIVDSAFSALAGAPFNAVVNVAILLPFVLAMWRPFDEAGAKA